MEFTQITLSNGSIVPMPADITVVSPRSEDLPDVDPEFIHSLAYIPWDNKYLDYVPAQYRDFYREIQPQLAARTTDVHTALSVSFVDELIQRSGLEVNKKQLVLAVLLHDIGWAQLSPAQIALSLNYSAFTYTEEALEPKRLHASLGGDIAREILRVHRETFHLSDDNIEYISKLVRFHDQINPWPEKPEPGEYLLLGDADRMWSYTHENFWLDTIRKNTKPKQYLVNTREAIDGYFLTDAGREIAHRLIEDRAREVEQV